MPKITTTPNVPTFAELLASVVNEPDQLERAFSRFHNFSLGNQILAWIQCLERGIVPGPIATYRGWQDLGRQVRKGERAIVLCMPVTLKRTVTNDDGAEETVTFTKFVYKPHWFVLAQTDGTDYVAPAAPEWEKARALHALGVTEIPFTHLNGNVQGYATGRSIAISPVAERPLATLVHELAHIVLGHTDQTDADAANLSRSTREVEAESVTLLVLGTLGEAGLEYCRGYVQHWLQGHTIDERTAQRIFKAADMILRAGRVAGAEEISAAA